MDNIDSVITHRLAQCYWNTWLTRMVRCGLKRHKPVAYHGYHGALSRDLVPYYDARRMVALRQDIEAGERLDPIEIDWNWEHNIPVRMVVLDGHHRFAAAVRFKLERIDISYGGPVDALQWLRGVRKRPPPTLYYIDDAT